MTTKNGASATVVHAVPLPGRGVTPCCGRTLFELPFHDRATLDRELVTCNAEPPSVPLKGVLIGLVLGAVMSAGIIYVVRRLFR